MSDTTITVRLFGALHAIAKERELPTTLAVDVPATGMTGVELAHALDLPLELIEGLFCNRTVYPLGHVLQRGDRVAFVPQGTPGPHRVFLGLYAAGQERPTDGQ